MHHLAERTQDVVTNRLEQRGVTVNVIFRSFYKRWLNISKYIRRRYIMSIYGWLYDFDSIDKSSSTLFQHRLNI